MRDEERQEVFRGHLEECLGHLGSALASRAPRGSKGAAQARKPIADFCGVQVDSVTRWLHHAGSLPDGESLVKLTCYLDMVGYRVIELERMPKGRRNFTELIGFGILSVREAADVLGYSKTDSLYQVLQGRQGASDDKDQKMWEAWKERKEKLQEKKEKAREVYRLDLAAEVQQKLGAASAASGRPKLASFRHAGVISIMDGLLVLLEESSVDELTEGDLAILRQSAGNTILQLSARFSALSSKLIISGQRKGGG